jgi:hypothetical protein
MFEEYYDEAELGNSALSPERQKLNEKNETLPPSDKEDAEHMKKLKKMDIPNIILLTMLYMIQGA